MIQFLVSFYAKPHEQNVVIKQIYQH